MSTLLIISHPEISSSTSQQFLLSSIEGQEKVTVHHLEKEYPTGEIDRERELGLLQHHNRVIFQFPFYWYSSPAFFKAWQDLVFSGSDLYTANGTVFSGKELGLVLTLGVKRDAYRAGGRELFTVDELTRPYQAFANHFGMIFKPSFNVHQFAYLTEVEKVKLVTDYQYYLTGANNESLAARSQWLIEALIYTNYDTLPAEKRADLAHIIEKIRENADEIADLGNTLAEF